MGGISQWIPLISSATQLVLAGCFILVALQFNQWRKHIIFFTSYLVVARGDDFNTLLHILATVREGMDEDDPRAHQVDRQMDVLADAKANHFERHMDDNGNAKRP